MKAALFSLLALAATAAAKTNLEGCTSSKTIAFGGASMVYWDPTNGEICSFLDCGGGRAPPKTTVPGCAAYVGTATYSPDYLPGWGSATATAEAGEETETGAQVVGVSMSGESVPAYETKTGTGSSTMVTSKAVLPSGTGGASVITSLTAANNVTASATPTSSAPVEATGAATRFGVRGGVVGVLAGVFGLAML